MAFMDVMAGDEPDLQDPIQEYIMDMEKFISEGVVEPKKRKHLQNRTYSPSNEPIEEYMVGLEKFISEGPPTEPKKRKIGLSADDLIRLGAPKTKYPCDQCGLGIFTSKANLNAHMKNNCKYRKVLEADTTTPTKEPIVAKEPTKEPIVEKPIVVKVAKEPKMNEKVKDQSQKKENTKVDGQRADSQKGCMDEMKTIELTDTVGYLMIPCRINIPV